GGGSHGQRKPVDGARPRTQRAVRRQHLRARRAHVTVVRGLPRVTGTVVANEVQHAPALRVGVTPANDALSSAEHEGSAAPVQRKRGLAPGHAREVVGAPKTPEAPEAPQSFARWGGARPRQGAAALPLVPPRPYGRAPRELTRLLRGDAQVQRGAESRLV